MIFNKIKFYINESYHRPISKIKSIQVSFLKLFYSNSTDIFSERSFLFKKPIHNLEFYNSFGRIILYLRLFISIIFYNRFPNSTNIKLNTKSDLHLTNNTDSTIFSIVTLIPII